MIRGTQVHVFVGEQIMLIATRYRLVLWMVLTLNLAGCLLNPERPDASAYGDPPHDYEQTAKDAIKALPYFDKHPDTWKVVSVGSPYRAYQNHAPAFGNKLAWTGYVVEVTVSVKNHIGYSNTDVCYVQFDGDKVFGVIGRPTEAGLHTL
jgi:hypothetical protein